MKKIQWLDTSNYQDDAELLVFLQSPLGKCAMLAIFSVVLGMMGISWWPIKVPLLYPWWPMVTLALIITSFLPQYRLWCLSVFSVIGLFWLPWFSWPAFYAPSWYQESIAIVAVLLFCCIYLGLAHKMKSHWLMRHPIINLMVMIFLMIWLASTWLSGSIKIYCWLFITVVSAYFWYISYTLLEVKQLNGLYGFSQVFAYLPFWGGTATPFPKGRMYLNKIASLDALSLARCQLSAFHLLLLAMLWHIALESLLIMQQAWNIPSMKFVLSNFSSLSHQDVMFYWRVLLLHFIFQTLSFGMNGHIIIAIVRMAGFKAARNMDNPFFATSISDFWNRYYFYFKELMVEVFFYPTFFSCFKKKPKLRLVFATVMAAGVGNSIYHLLAEIKVLQSFGLLKSIIMMQTYFFYALILSIAIGISQLRAQRLSAVIPFWRRYLTIPLGVVGFYCILSVFNQPYYSTNIMINFQFLTKLVGL